jgi:hypothetical protein
MSSLDETLNIFLFCALCFLIWSIITFIIDLVDIIKNGLSLNNNGNKLIMFILIFFGIILAFTEIELCRCENTQHKRIIGIVLISFAFLDLFFLAFFDLTKLNFSFLLLFKLFGYLFSLALSWLVELIYFQK